MPIKVAPPATSDRALPSPDDDRVAASERSADSRLARVHLRGGLLALSRAALEQMAGAGTLDRDAMADLAEVRWRGGDLLGAADAARAHQASGGHEPLAALIIAEELVRSDQEAEARTEAQAVLERVGGAIDILFALEPRSDIWPEAAPGWMPVGADGPGHWGLLVGGSELTDPEPTTWQLAPRTEPRSDDQRAGAAPLGRGEPGLGAPGAPASTDAVVMTGRLAGDELEIADRAISTGDIAAASQRLALLLRLDPALAPVILSSADRAAEAAAGHSRDLVAVHLVRGDAYRTIGRDTEAAAAYQQAHQALKEGSPTKEST